MNTLKKIFKLIKKSALVILVLIMLLLVVVTGCRLLVKSTNPDIFYQGNLSDASDYDYILVPGAGIAMAKPSTHLRDRLDTAISLYNLGAAPKIIVSGAYDEVEMLNESTVMKIYLTSNGIPEDNIICDEYGDCTAETLRRARDYDGDKKFIVCTQSLYFERTTYLANRYKIDISVADSDIRIYTHEVNKSRIRELLAATKAVFEGTFCKKSSFQLDSYPFIVGGQADE